MYYENEPFFKYFLCKLFVDSNYLDRYSLFKSHPVHTYL